MYTIVQELLFNITFYQSSWTPAVLASKPCPHYRLNIDSQIPTMFHERRYFRCMQ